MEEKWPGRGHPEDPQRRDVGQVLSPTLCCLRKQAGFFKAFLESNEGQVGAVVGEGAAFAEPSL